MTGEGLATSRAPHPHDGLESGVVASTSLQEQHVETLRKIERGDPLTDAELQHLEAIVIPNGLRPSFDVVNGSFADLPAPWTEANSQCAVLEPSIRSIGRLDLVGHPARPIAGTAFVVAPDLLLTNRHVAEFFVDGIGTSASVSFKPGMSAALDFRHERIARI